MDQQDFELQLKVWKELAISKQVLLRSVTDALKLDPSCTQDQLKEAIEVFLKKIAQADAEVKSAQEQARTAIAEAEKRITAAEKASAAAQATAAQLTASQERMQRDIEAERSGMATELQKLKDRVNEKEKALKAINTALADTPENVLKKMNAFKKQKQDEADARRQVEASFTALRKEKQQQDQKLATLQENVAKLSKQHRELHDFAAKLHEQLKSDGANDAEAKGPDAKMLAAPPALDEDLLQAIENPDAKPDAKNKNDKNKKK
ncbi:MAG TPA: hypothetical protein VK025_04180 [Steroidobacter sp.]|nr:hypothetical protein [Steroidobacteraceae bacterium]HLS80582.1 hypothetical protein [Steroidobacter sp.]